MRLSILVSNVTRLGTKLGGVGAIISCSACSASGAGSGPGDSGTVPTFTQIYTNVIAPTCMPCHTSPIGEGISLGKLDMSTQASAFKALVGVAAAGSECAGKGMRVTAGHADASVFYLKLSADDPSPCGAKMPLSGTLISADQANGIASWINVGAPNN